MVGSQFDSLLKEFESFFACALVPDSNHSCLIIHESGVELQIEMDRSGMILIGSRIGAPPLGRYRENLIQHVLKANEAGPLSSGIFGFSHASSQLIIFIKIHPSSLNQHLVTTLLPPFLAKAKTWKEAIEKGELPPVSFASSSKASSGLFGLR